MKKKNSYLRFGMILIIIPIVFCLISPVICKFDSSYVDSAVRLTAPNSIHLMGTDDLGRDIMARMAEGTRNSLEIGICVAIITSILGLILGYLVSFYKMLNTMNEKELVVMKATAEGLKKARETEVSE